jgi:hypothetical protein
MRRKARLLSIERTGAPTNCVLGLVGKKISRFVGVKFQRDRKV